MNETRTEKEKDTYGDYISHSTTGAHAGQSGFIRGWPEWKYLEWRTRSGIFGFFAEVDPGTWRSSAEGTGRVGFRFRFPMGM